MPSGGKALLEQRRPIERWMFSCGYRLTDRVESVCYQTLPPVAGGSAIVVVSQMEDKCSKIEASHTRQLSACAKQWKPGPFSPPSLGPGNEANAITC